MLGVAVTTCSSSPGPLPSCWSPGRCLGTQCTCPGRGTWLPPSHVQDQPAVKLSTCPRDPHGTLTWPVTGTATDEALLSTVPTRRSHTTHKHWQLLLGWQRQVTGAGTHMRLSGCTSTCTSMVPFTPHSAYSSFALPDALPLHIPSLVFTAPGIPFQHSGPSGLHPHQLQSLSLPIVY